MGIEPYSLSVIISAVLSRVHTFKQTWQVYLRKYVVQANMKTRLAQVLDLHKSLGTWLILNPSTMLKSICASET